MEEKKILNVLDTVHYWAFCIADAYREQMDDKDLGCDERWQIANFFARKFVKSSLYRDTDMSGYDACMEWCEDNEKAIFDAINTYGKNCIIFK